MDRNNMRSSYVNSGQRSLPHMNNNSKRHSNSNNSRLSPPAQSVPTVNIIHNNNNNTHSSQHDDLIQYIYESWNKVTRELERGSDDAKYYQEMHPRQLPNFRPFNLEDWWARRLVQTINRKPRS